MKNNRLNTKMCSGCRACVQLCPVSAIDMVEDEKGFFQPNIDDKKCINCGLCERKCPMFTKPSVCEYDRLAYMAFQKDLQERNKSASGGVFAALAKAMANKGKYAIFGAEFDDDLKVHHTYINDYKDINRMRKSKYVQSNTRDTFSECKDFLEKDYNVLYSGTPCQIAGLKTFLGKKYDNLVTVDVLCRGVSNQKIFDSYIKCIEKKTGERVTGYAFRHKVKNMFGDINSKNCLIKTAGKDLVYPVERDLYSRGYHSGLFYRESCYNCTYACPERISDLTLGDYWHIDRIIPEYDAIEGISGVLVNTQKGYDLINECREDLLIKETTAEQYINSNSQLRESAKANDKREKFFQMWEEEGFEKAVDICAPKYNMVKVSLKRALPRKTKTIVKKIIRKK